MDVEAWFPAHGEPAELVQQGDGLQMMKSRTGSQYRRYRDREAAAYTRMRRVDRYIRYAGAVETVHYSISTGKDGRSFF